MGSPAIKSPNLYSYNAISGVGIGLRAPHINKIISEKPIISWLEVLADNYLNMSGDLWNKLTKIREYYPLTLHSVSMSLGATTPLNIEYLNKIKTLLDTIEASFISDHLCWCNYQKQHLPDLLPLPFTEEAIAHITKRIQVVQDLLGRNILIENISSYLAFNASTMPEWEFIKAIVTAADCYILLDINNLYVSGKNLNFSPLEYLKNLPKNRIKQIHLAGFENKGSHLLDTHSQKIHSEVWQLYETAIKLFGEIPTLIEWDNEIPELSVLLEEAKTASLILKHKELSYAS